MFLNHIKTAIRTLRKHPSYALLNIIGLTSGLVVFILITLYTTHEFSYDRYHEKADRLYRVYKEDIGNYYKGTNKYAVVPTPLAIAMKQDYPEVEEVAHINYHSNTVVRVNNEIYLEPRIHTADPAIFDMFSFKIIAGSKESILQDHKSVVISERLALKYFDKLDVLGEVIRFRDQFPVQVSGVIKNMPENSHFVMDLILNYEGVIREFDSPERLTNWNNSSHYSFVLLTPGTDAQALEARLPELRAKYADDPVDEDGQESIYYLQPLNEMHFTQEVNFDLAPSTNARSLYIYLGIAFMILVIAGINYVNLATARVINKTKEIGIRKVIGAQKRNLVGQLMVESGLLVALALTISLLLLVMIVPLFATFIDKPLGLDLSSITLWGLLLGLGLGVTVLAGAYPAFMLANFRPIMALKGIYSAGRGSSLFRNALVVFQFAVSGVLILGATVLTRQLNYIQHMDTGYERDQVVVMGIRDRGLRDQLDVFKEELRRIPGVVNVTSSNSLPNNISSNTNANWPGRQEGERVVLYTNTADPEFVNLYDLEIVEGRNFDANIASDETAILLNESAVKALGWENPVGRQMIRWFGDTGRVVGVLKDFHAHSVHLAIEPIQIFQRSGQFNVSIKIEGDQMEKTLMAIEAKYQEFDPVYPFDYNFFDDIFDRAYMTEIKTAKLANWFTGLAILIACLGLYGLAMHKVQHRIKEVGVRKVLGASVAGILVLLSKDFARLLLIAFLVAAPVAYFVMNSWLANFAYHIEINVFTFALALVLMLLVAGLTVGYRTFRAAMRNPVEALRDE